MTAPDSLDGTDPLLRGVGLDAQTRCAHYATARDVVALRFACCPAYWSCHRCHAELADHPAVPVPAGDFDRPHVLCGVCRTELSVTAYLALEATADPACPACGAPFNPGCAAHAPLYFDVPASGSPAGEADPAAQP